VSYNIFCNRVETKVSVKIIFVGLNIQLPEQFCQNCLLSLFTSVVYKMLNSTWMFHILECYFIFL